MVRRAVPLKVPVFTALQAAAFYQMPVSGTACPTYEIQAACVGGFLPQAGFCRVFSIRA